MIYHVYKTDCLKASRVVMQSNWVGSNVYVHKSNSYRKIDKELNFKNIFKVVLNLRKNDVMLFHAQSSLIYHAFALFVARLLFKNINTIYDIHDLNECSTRSSVYLKARFLLMHVLEVIIIKYNKVQVITVSEGLARIIQERFSVEQPIVIYNCSFNTTAEVNPISSRLNRPLFFGTAERFPFQILPKLHAENIELDFYGRGITDDLFKEKECEDYKSRVRDFGEYTPDNLDFINSYMVSLNYSPNYLSLNFKYSLPNKLFQAIYSGCTVLVSENFHEMSELFSDLNYAVVKTSNEDFITDYYRIINNKTDLDVQHARDRVRDLYCQSRSSFQSLMVNK